MQDILYVDKPKNMTSFDVIRDLRKRLGIKKMGHAGTLDPRATGLLIIGINEGTKKLTDYIGQDKTYRAEMLLGIKTTTGDLDGDTVEEKDMSDMSISETEVLDVLKSLEGEQELSVSVYSAIKQGGEALYKKARRGEPVEAPRRVMDIQKLTFESMEKEKKTIRVVFTADVGSGTYIRSIAEAIGERLGYPATLAELRRARIGVISIEQAIPPNEIA